MQMFKRPVFRRSMLALALGLLSPVLQAETDKALIMLNSDLLQTQAMAMVLGNALQAQGVEVDVLLCDAGAKLALTETVSAQLKPVGVTPEQLMMKLQKGGADVAVCALFLPNSTHSRKDLRPGIQVAKPPVIAQQMMTGDTRVFVY